MKKTVIILSMIVLLMLIIQTVKAQTNVSGGIYSNTTWTTANSPYIVVDTVVVFPGVTLTIQPGVIVKFDNNKRLDIAQAKLIAIGTEIDSIKFMSNSTTWWKGIYFDNCIDTSIIDYCNFSNCSKAIDVSGNVLVNHSRFINNYIGINNGYIVKNSTFY